MTNRPVCRSRRGDAAKVIIIVLASLFGLFVLTCAGVGVLGYFWYQKNLSRAMLTKPEDIRQLTADMTDITLPPEFQPIYGSDMPMLSMKNVAYRWCPSGNCPSVDTAADELADELGDTQTLTLSSFGAEVGSDPDGLGDEAMSDEYLKDMYVDFTKDVHEFTIRGKACKFYIIRGEMQSEFAMDGETPPVENAADTESPLATAPAVVPELEKPPAAPKGTGKIHVSVQGTFPGKTGTVTLGYQSSAEKFDEAKILAILQSIR